MTTYTAEDVQVLSSGDAIRRRPGMYIGEPNSEGLHNMLWEVVGNGLDEIRGRGGPGHLQIAFDGARAIVEDDGGGIPPEAIESIMTQLHGPGAWRRHHAHIRTDLHGAGVAVTCALSSELDVETWCDGRAFGQRFARGAAIGPIEDRGSATGSGTRVAFTPDFTILEARTWDVALVARRARELAAFAPGLTVTVDDDIFCAPEGARDLVRFLAGDGPLIEPFHARAHRDGIDVEVAIAWADRVEGALHSFVNLSATRDGTHVEGMFAGLRTVLAPRVPSLRRLGQPKLRARLSRGMIAIVHAELGAPRFGNPMKDWLENEEVRDAVRGVVESELPAHFARAPALLDSLLISLERR